MAWQNNPFFDTLRVLGLLEGDDQQPTNAPVMQRRTPVVDPGIGGLPGGPEARGILEADPAMSPAPPAPVLDPTQYPSGDPEMMPYWDEMQREARLSSMMDMGMKLAAMGQEIPATQRAELMANSDMGSSYPRNLYNLAQARLMAGKTPGEKGSGMRSQLETINGRVKLVNMDTGDIIADLGEGNKASQAAEPPKWQSEFDKEFSKAEAKAADALVQAGDAAPGMIQTLEVLREVAKGAPQGRLAQYSGVVTSIMEDMGASPAAIEAFTGLDPNSAAYQDAFNKIVNEMTIGKIGPGGFPAQNFSNADLQFLKDAMPALASRPEANDLKVEIAIRAAKVQQEAKDSWRAYVAEARARGQSPDWNEWNMMWAEELNGRPSILEDLAPQIEALARGGPAPAPGPAPEPGNTGGPPPGVDPEVWEEMTPEERAAWQS
jgi:hypothetical protein